VHQYFDMVEQG